MRNWNMFDTFSKYYMKIVRRFQCQSRRGRHFLNQQIGNESLREISNDNGVRLVHFVTSKNLRVKSTMFPHRNIYKYTLTSPDGKTHDQIDHILLDGRRHLNVSGQQIVIVTTIWWWQRETSSE
jgi:hypothetical protein